MYTIKQEATIKMLSEILSAYGVVGVTEEKVKNIDIGDIKTEIKRKVNLIWLDV